MTVALAYSPMDTQTAFFAWLKEAGVGSPELEVTYNDRGDRVLVTCGSLSQGDTSLSVPRAAVMCTDKAAAWFAGQGLGDEVSAGCSQHALLAAWLLAEHADPASPWLPYLQMLPEAFPEVPLFYPSSIQQWLDGSLAGAMLEKRRRQIERDYLHLSQTAPFFRRFTLARFQWAMSVVASRCFSLSAKDRPHAVGLVPLIDLANHDASPNHHWSYDEDHAAFRCTTVEPLAAGREMTLPYGCKSNQRFWLHYGFLDQEHDQWAAGLKVEPAENDPQRRDKMIEIQNLGGPLFTITGNDAFESLGKTLSALRCCLGDWGDFAVRHRVRAGAVLDRVSERRVIQALAACCRAALTQRSAPSPSQDSDDFRLETVRRILYSENKVLAQILAFACFAEAYLNGDDPARAGEGFPFIWARTWVDNLPVETEVTETLEETVDVSRLALIPVTRAHWPALCRLRVRPDQEAFVPHPLNVLRAQVFQKEQPAQVVAVQYDGEIVGMFTSKARSADVVWFAHFLIDQSVQGRGIGRWAFEQYIQTLVDGGYRGTVGLNVYRDNHAMIQFYSRQGFEFDPSQDVGDHVGMKFVLPS